jgi:prephenate dehydrogenase
MPSAGTLALLIPILIFLLPIVAVLTQHQRKMAEIIHANKGANTGDLDALREEVARLRELVEQQTIALDNLSSRMSLPSQVERNLS